MTDVSDDSLPEWTDEELALLRTADDDRPPGRSLAAALAAVGSGGAVVSAAAAAKAASLAAAANGAAVAGTGSAVTTAKATSFILITKWVGAVALGGAVVTGGVALVRQASDEPPAPVVTRPEIAPRREPSRAPAVAAPEPEPAVSAPPLATTEAPASPQSSGRAPAVRSQPDISLEIAAIDEARTVLRAGRPGEALAALDRYDAHFAKGGSLRVEATALRIEALLLSGKRERATALANGFLARYPKSPYAARVRGLIGAKSTE